MGCCGRSCGQVPTLTQNGANPTNAGNTAPSATVTTTRNASWVFGVCWNERDERRADRPGRADGHDHRERLDDHERDAGALGWVQQQTAVSGVSGSNVTIDDTAPSAFHGLLVQESLATAATLSAQATIIDQAPKLEDRMPDTLRLGPDA